jgi:hypothetical protein
MDSGNGRFEEVSREIVKEEQDKRDSGRSSRIDRIFSVGEVVDVKDSKFTIRSIDNFTGIMVLKLKPRAPGER